MNNIKFEWINQSTKRQRLSNWGKEQYPIHAKEETKFRFKDINNLNFKNEEIESCKE